MAPAVLPHTGKDGKSRARRPPRAAQSTARKSKRKDPRMPKELSFEAWKAINPALARAFRVIPWKRTADCLYLLTDTNLSEDQRRDREAQLASAVQGKVRLETLGSPPDKQRQVEFKETFDRFYRVNFDCLTVLVLDPEGSWARRYAAAMKVQGHFVDAVESLDQAVAQARKYPRKLSLVLIADELTDEFEEAQTRLAKVTKAPIFAVSAIDKSRRLILLLDPEMSRAHHYTDEMGEKGQVVLHATTLPQALRYAQALGQQLCQVLVADDIEGGSEAARKQLAEVTRVPIQALLETNANRRPRNFARQ